MARQNPLLAVLLSKSQYKSCNNFQKRQNTHPILTAGLLDTSSVFAADTIAGGSTADSAEVPRAMAGGEVGTVASGHGQAEERGDQEHILHFDRLRELIKESFESQRTRKVHTEKLSLKESCEG